MALSVERERERGIDIVAGGFPCQPFSHAGKRTGTTDDRYLWPEMCRIIGEIRPTWVFAENVDGLVSMAQSDWDLVMEDETTICEEAEMVIETIRKDLENLGYRSIPIIIPACSVGASHRRYRIFILGHAERSGCSREPRRRAGEEPSDGHRELESQPMANSTGERSAEEGKLRPGGSEKRTAGGSADVSDTESQRRREGGSEPTGQPRESSLVGGGSLMADTNGAGQQERYASTISDGKGYDSRGRHPHGATWATQSGLGGVPYELSDWLDGWGMNPLDALINFISSFPQPALMGQDQYNWEPPRVATGIKNRAARLKALGNAVDPLQALPVLYGIRIIHDYLRGESL